MVSEALVNVEDQYDGDAHEEEAYRASRSATWSRRLTSPSLCAFLVVGLFACLNYLMDLNVDDQDMTSISNLRSNQSLSQGGYAAAWGRGVPSFSPEQAEPELIAQRDHAEMNFEAEAPENMKDVEDLPPTQAPRPAQPDPQPKRTKNPFVAFFRLFLAIFRDHWFSMMLILALVEVILRDYLMEVTRKERRMFAGVFIAAYSTVLLLSGRKFVIGFESMLMYWVLQGISICRSPVVLQQREDLYRF